MTDIRGLRKKKQLSQSELAYVLDVDRSTVAKWETGKSAPSAALLPRIADLLGCALCELSGGEAAAHVGRMAAH